MGHFSVASSEGLLLLSNRLNGNDNRLNGNEHKPCYILETKCLSECTG